ncbi:MAG: PH domain-containing protein [Nitrosomonas sp.]|nr:PH domain-containing protein [Nitrosomonas sp.]
MDVFKSKIDKWILICFALSLLACLLGTSVMIKVGGTANYVIAAVILIIGAGFPAWILASTKYVVGDGDLKIISGPFSWNIPIQSITFIQETQTAITSPALSFDRLEITYGEGKAILVSPEDKATFIRKLGAEKLIVPGKSAQQQATDKISQTSNKKSKRNQQNS